MRQGYKQIIDILQEEFSSKGCEHIFKQGEEYGVIYESHILFDIEDKNLENPNQETFISFSRRVQDLCKTIGIKYISIDEEYLIANEDNYNRNKLKNFKPYKYYRLYSGKHQGNFELFFNEILRYPIKPVKKLNDLITTIKQGEDYDIKEVAKRELIKSNLKACASIARFFWIYGIGINYMDVVQEGTLGIILAIEKYNPYIGGRFYDFVGWSIKQCMRKFIGEQLPFFEIPLHVDQERKIFNEVYDSLYYKLSRKPNDKELAKATGFPLKKIKKLGNLEAGVISLDKVIGEHGESLAELLVDCNTLRPDQLAQRDCLRANLDMVLGMLDERERTVITMRFGLNKGIYYTLEQVGDELNITRERVRQIEQGVIKKLREHQGYHKILDLTEELEKLEDENIMKKREKLALLSRKRRSGNVSNIDGDDDFDFEGCDEDDDFDIEGDDENIDETKNTENDDFDIEGWNNENVEVDNNTENHSPTNNKDEDFEIEEITDSITAESTDYANPFFAGNTYRENDLHIPMMSGVPYSIVTVINAYMNTLNENKKFSIDEFNQVFVNSFYDETKDIFNKRINIRNGKDKETLEEIAEEYGRTVAWIYNSEKSIYKRIDVIYKALGESDFGKDYIQKYIDSNYMDDDYGIIDFQGFDKGGIYSNFMSYSHNILLSAQYEIYQLNNKSGSIKYLYFNSELIKSDILKKYFERIDEIYKTEREEEKYYEKELLEAKVIKGYEDEYFTNNGYSYFITQYLSNVYSIYLLSNGYRFPKNKDTMKYKIIKEFNQFDRPVHYTEIQSIMNEKYSEINRSDAQIINVLSKIGKPLGNGMYANENCDMSGGNIGDLVEECIIKSGGPVSEGNIIEYVKKNKFVNDSSIIAVFTQDSRFVKVSGGSVGLSKRGAPEQIKNLEIENNIIKVLNNNPGRDFSNYELYTAVTESVKVKVGIDEYSKCRDELIKNGKIGITKKDITNYYHVL